MGDKGKIRIKALPTVCAPWCRAGLSYTRTQISPDPDFVTRIWDKLRSAIIQIQQQKNESDLSFEELYRYAYNLILHKQGAVLYEGLENVVRQHMQVLADRIQASVHDRFLDTLNKLYEEHHAAMIMIRDILLYMDRSYIKDEREPVFELGMTLFREVVINDHSINQHLRAVLMDMITKERHGEAVDRAALKRTCDMLMALGNSSRIVYESNFERPFLVESAAFFREEGLRYLADQDASVYLQRVQTRIAEELARVVHCMDESTAEPLRRVLETELLRNHMGDIINMERSGVVAMLQHSRIQDLRRAYTLFQRIPEGMQAVCTCVQQHLEAAGRAIVEEELQSGTKNAVKYVQSLIQLKDQCDVLLQDAFAQDALFIRAVNAAFVATLNLNTRSPEYVSLFIDDWLRRGRKDASEAEEERVLNQTMVMFRFIQDKDVFERYYKQHLAKRLLLNRSLSDEAEQTVITRLKTECGHRFTSKLEGMFNDMTTSQTTMQAFRQHLSKTTPALPFDLHVRVLTTVHWPTVPSSPLVLPPEMSGACDVFRDFYCKKHSGRKLTWQPALGTVDLSAWFAQRTRHHIVQVSTQQAVLLLAFNDVDELSYEQLRTSTQIPDIELKRALQSLACGKARVLVKRPATRDVGDEDRFAFNDRFSSKLTRVKIQQIAQRETAPESSATRSKVDEDRRHQIEACIVRIMKARRRMPHAALVAEVAQQLAPRFMAAPPVIKKRIERLIEGEYLERTKEDRNTYNYLA